MFDQPKCHHKTLSLQMLWRKKAFKGVGGRPEPPSDQEGLRFM